MSQLRPQIWIPEPIPESANWNDIRGNISKRLGYSFPALIPDSKPIPASRTPSGIATVWARNRKALRLHHKVVDLGAVEARQLKDADRCVTKFLGRRITGMNWGNLHEALEEEVMNSSRPSNDEFSVQKWLQNNIPTYILPFVKLVVLEDLKDDKFNEEFQAALIRDLYNIMVDMEQSGPDKAAADIFIQSFPGETILDDLKPIAQAQGKVLELSGEDTLLLQGRTTITFFELKKWNTHPIITSILDEAIECGVSIHTFDTFEAAMEESYQSAGKSVPTKTHLQTAYATFLQVLEQMDTRMCSHVVLTTVYGSWYEVYKNQDDKGDATYHWTTNMASDECKLAHNNNAYRQDERVLLEIVDRVFFFLLTEVEERIQTWRSILANAKDENSLELGTPKRLLVPLPSLPTMAQVRTGLSGFVPLWLQFRLTATVLSSVMDPLSLDYRYILGSTIYLNLRRIAGGYGAVVWQDTGRGVVLKQFVEEKTYRKEVHFYSRLRGVPWIPTVLGTTSTEGRWGIFLTYEGWSMGDVEWCDSDVQTFVKDCVRELHKRGIHHHDLAPRNILRRPDRSFALVDFGMAVDEKDCKGGEDCPDCELVSSF